MFPLLCTHGIQVFRVLYHVANPDRSAVEIQYAAVYTEGLN